MFCGGGWSRRGKSAVDTGAWSFLTFPDSLGTVLPMDSLHAPWRIEYILAPKPSLPGSLFALIAQSNDDEANYVIARDRTCYALLNTYPYTGGHLMVVPYKQVPDLNGLTDDELRDLLRLTRRCQNRSEERRVGKECRSRWWPDH